MISKNINHYTPINPLLFNTSGSGNILKFSDLIDFVPNPINFIDPLGLDILSVNSVAQTQDNNNASQQSIGGGAITPIVTANGTYNSTVRNFGCVYASQVNGANAANELFDTGKTADFSEFNNTETFGDDYMMTDTERKAFQEKATGLDIEVNRTEGNAAAIAEIQRLQADPEITVTIEARVNDDTHSININGITVDEDGNMKLDSFETAGYYDGNYDISEITGIRVTSYSNNCEEN